MRRSSTKHETQDTFFSPFPPDVRLGPRVTCSHQEALMPTITDAPPGVALGALCRRGALRPPPMPLSLAGRPLGKRAAFHRLLHDAEIQHQLARLLLELLDLFLLQPLFVLRPRPRAVLPSQMAWDVVSQRFSLIVPETQSAGSRADYGCERLYPSFLIRETGCLRAPLFGHSREYQCPWRRGRSARRDQSC